MEDRNPYPDSTKVSYPDDTSSAVKAKVNLLMQLMKFEEKGYTLSKYFTIQSPLEEIEHELSILKETQRTEEKRIDSIKKCIAYGCGNFLQPDEDFRCKKCDY